MMRAVLMSLTGVILLSSNGVGAAECHPGRAKLVSGERTFTITKAAVSSGKFAGYRTYRAIYEGRMAGKPYVFDIEGMQGSSTSFTSEAGRLTASQRTGKWNRKIDFANGDDFDIYSGPLDGTWKAVCR